MQKAIPLEELATAGDRGPLYLLATWLAVHRHNRRAVRGVACAGGDHLTRTL